MFIKRLAASVLAVSFIVPAMLFASCGKAEPKLKDPVKISEDTPWYSSEITTIDTGFDPSDFLFFSSGAVGMIDDLVIFSSGGELLWDPYDFTNAAPSVCTIHVYDIEGNHIYDKDLKEVVSSANPQGDNFLVQNFSIDGDYLKIWALWNEGENLITKVIRYDPKTEQIVSTEDPKVAGDYKVEDSVTLKNTIADGYNVRTFYVYLELGYANHIEFTTPEGEIIDVNLDDTFDANQICQLHDYLYLGDGKFIFKLEDFALQKIYCYVDLVNYKVADAATVDEYSWIYSVPDAWDFSYREGVGNAIVTRNGIDILDLDTHTKTNLVSYDNCDLNRYDAASLTPLYADENKIILAGSSIREQFEYMKTQDIHKIDTSLIVLEKADKNPNAGKTILTATCVQTLSYSMAEAIRIFNDTNSEAFIMLDPKYDYETVSETVERDPEMDDTTYDLKVRAAMMDMLSIDLLAGDGPDIILGAMNYTQLNKDDYLLDLSEEVNVPDVYENIMNSAKTDKELYQVPLAFGLEGILVNKADVDSSAAGFTYDSYKEYIKGPCNGKDPVRLDQLDFMCTCLAEMNNEFHPGYDYDYNNKNFSKIAEFVSELVLPSKQDIERERAEFELSTHAKRPAFVNIASPMELLSYTCNEIDSQIMMGFPSANGSGLMINVSQSVAVSNVNSNHEACKEFVRMLVGYDMQQLFAMYDGISINSKAEAEACRSYVERTNAAYEAISKYWDPIDLKQLQGFDTVADPELLVTQMDGYIRSAAGLHSIDSEVQIIVREEIQAYFAGQKTIKEVMKTIQNRVDVYCDERG